MKLKKTFTFAVDEKLALRIEKYKEATNKSYTDLFIEAIKKYLDGFI